MLKAQKASSTRRYSIPACRIANKFNPLLRACSQNKKSPEYPGYTETASESALIFRQQRRNARHHRRVVDILLRHTKRFRVVLAAGAA